MIKGKVRKLIVLIILSIILSVSIGFVNTSCKIKPQEELFGDELAIAPMKTYQDKDFGFTVRYPSFFIKQPDSLNDYIGYARFSYADHWANIILESYVAKNYSRTLRLGMDSFTKALHATRHHLGKNYFILSGPQYENGSYVDGYSFYSKYVSNGKLWFVYTMVYPNSYHNYIGRLFYEIKQWTVWNNRLILNR